VLKHETLVLTVSECWCGVVCQVWTCTVCWNMRLWCWPCLPWNALKNVFSVKFTVLTFDRCRSMLRSWDTSSLMNSCTLSSRQLPQKLVLILRAGQSTPTPGVWETMQGRWELTHLVYICYHTSSTHPWHAYSSGFYLRPVIRKLLCSWWKQLRRRWWRNEWKAEFGHGFHFDHLLAWLIGVSKAPFTRYNLLWNLFDNRLNGCIHETRQLVVKLVVQPGLITGWMHSGCSFNMVVKAVSQLAVSCKQTSNRLLNRFDNRLDVCLHDTTGSNRLYNWLYHVNGV